MTSSRPYKKKARAQQEAETRQRIIEAAVATHESRGAASTISEIAKLADVSRVTLYRHFPDELALISACTSHYLADHPLPDLSTWAAIDDPRERLRKGLADTYAYHRENVRMMTASEHAVGVNPTLAHLMEPLAAYWGSAVDTLAQGFDVDYPTSAPIKPAIALALALPTWRQLAMELNMTDEECTSMFVQFITCLRAS